jgi:NADPH:quinone reductase-like Zn-dependent oxidoreductase
MKAFLISAYAHPSKIQLTHDAPEPTPTPGSDDLLINVHSAALNFFDVRFSPSLPSTCAPSHYIADSLSG